ENLSRPGGGRTSARPQQGPSHMRRVFLFRARRAHHIDRPEAPRLPAYPRPRGSSRAERGDHVKPWAKWFYKSKAWQKTREAYIAARHGLCERCGAGGKIVHHKVYLTPDNI